jgi:NOL1/NOP2/fmu family ribosome biogenesis protein
MNTTITPIENRTIVTDYFYERFRIPAENFDAVIFLHSGSSYWAFETEDPLGRAVCSLKRTAFAGMRVLRILRRYLKPTSYALQRFGSGATRNVLDLTEPAFREFLETGETAAVGPPDEDGYVIVRRDGENLGCGLYLGGRLLNRFPKGRSRALAGASRL